jgi:hypothetical protein
METKKPYTSPELKKWGTVADLTQTGKTTEGNDAKTGSSPSSGT